MVPSARAVRSSGTVQVDGRLDEAAWRTAPPVTDFTQSDPDEGKPASQRTEVRFLYDDAALYIGAKMYDSQGPTGVATRLVRRDASFDSDILDIEIDSYHDHLSRAIFQVNPAGSKADQIGVGNSCCDESWDPVWQAATHIDEDGWTAELRIPYSQLRFAHDTVQVWGLQIARMIKRREESDLWAFNKKSESGGPSRYGHLFGVRVPASSQHIELLPYAVTKSSWVTGAEGDPFAQRGKPSMRVGLDLKDRLTSNLTLDATFNPDFGQVEVDPAVLNLSAFETFFPEKRPFFVEGAQVFAFSNMSCNFCDNAQDMNAFYSRRIGRAPTGASLATQNYQFSDVPNTTTILGAAKLTGRTSQGYTLGLLNAVTGRATADVVTANGLRGKQEVEPVADYFVARGKRDFMNGNLVAGLVASGVVRNIDSTFAPLLAKHAELLGHDLFYSTADHKYDVRMQASVTNVSGDPREILLRQESSARYFQRPDRGGGSGGFFSNGLDSAATSLRGGGVYARAAKETGFTFGEVSFDTRTPGYESNDYAFQTRADYIFTSSNFGLNWTTPTRWYHGMAALVGGQFIRNYEGDLTQVDYHIFAQATTPQFWNIHAFAIDFPSVIDDKQLRGGPAVRTVHGHFANMNASTDSRHAFVVNLGASYQWDAAGGNSPNVSLGFTYRPSSQVSLSFSPSYSRSHNYAYYVTSVADATASAFYGSRYVMAVLDQPVLGLDTRASFTFTPTMTLEVYAQPFFAAGRYSSFEEYVAPRSRQVAVYGRDRGTIAEVRDTTGRVAQYAVDPDAGGPAPGFRFDNPNFSQQSLRGNAVFRWEYRPGSVLYLAWTQSRAAGDSFGDLEFVRDRSALFRTKPDNIFLVKASWWLSR
ncbi:MAG TPA: DUF5916 domain-containing protein [Gemmatimonadaceae bacterium]|nr:DUF5916 domain-containing protein [Gemmatimonadaceae bacterium]